MLSVKSNTLLFGSVIRSGYGGVTVCNLLYCTHSLTKLGIGHGAVYLIPCKGKALAGKYDTFGFAISVMNYVHTDAPCGKCCPQSLHSAAILQRLINAVMDTVFNRISAFQPVAVNLLLPLAESKAVFPCKFLCYPCRLPEVLVSGRKWRCRRYLPGYKRYAHVGAACHGGGK